MSPWNYRVDSRGNWRAYERNTGEDLVWNIDLEDWETFFGDPDTREWAFVTFSSFITELSIWL